MLLDVKRHASIVAVGWPASLIWLKKMGPIWRLAHPDNNELSLEAYRGACMNTDLANGHFAPLPVYERQVFEYRVAVPVLPTRDDEDALSTSRRTTRYDRDDLRSRHDLQTLRHVALYTALGRSAKQLANSSSGKACKLITQILASLCLRVQQV